MKIYILIFTIIVLTDSIKTYGTNIDSLLIELNKQHSDSSRLKILMAITRAHIFTKPEAGMEFAHDAIALATKLNDKAMIANTYINLGGLNYKTGNFRDAFDLYFKALQIKEEINDIAGTAMLYNNLGNIKHNQAHFEEALKYYQKCIQVCLQFDDLLNMSRAQNNIATLYLTSDRYEESIEAYKKVVQTKLALNDLPGLSNTYHNLGITYRVLENFDSSFYYLDKEKEIIESEKLQHLKIANTREYAKSFYAKGNIDSAITYAKKGMDLAYISKSKFEILESVKLMYSLYEKKMDFKKAFEYLKLSVNYEDTLYNERYNKEMLELEARYENTKKEKENAILKAEKEMQAALLERNKNIIIMVVSALFLSLIVAFFLYKSIKKEKQNKETLQKKNTEIQKKNSELQDLTEILKKQKQKLEELNLIKDKIFSIIGHDLRSPLASLSGFYYILEAETDISFIRKILPSIRKDLNNTSELLDNLLYWSKQQMNGLKVVPEPLVLLNVVNEVASLVQTAANRKNIYVKNFIKNDVQIFADKDMTQLILRNIIFNAIKFTPEKGSIILKAWTENNMTYLSISDTGVGIEKEDLESIFSLQKPVKRGTSNEKGTGLGLVLCKEFCLKNGGDILVSSLPGEGSTFTLLLPEKSNQ